MKPRALKKSHLAVWIPLLSAAGFAGLFLWPLVIHPLYAPMTYVVQTTDFFTNHLAMAQYIHDSIVQYHQIPLWNEHIFSGQPLAADPLAGLWYLPNWIIYLFPTATAYNLLLFLHLTWGGYGVFRLLRSDKINAWAATFGMVAFVGTPRLIGYIGSGQMSWVFAYTWTPWVLIASKNTISSTSFKNSALAGITLGLLFLADIRWGVYAAALTLCYFLANYRWFAISSGRKLLIFTSIFILTGLLIAVQVLPLLEFVGFTRRSGITGNEAGIFSLTGQMVSDLIFPHFGGLSELIIYLGVAPLAFALIGAFDRRWIWIGIGLLAIFLSSGIYTRMDLSNSRAFLGLNLLRVPLRAWFAVIFATTMLAGYGLNLLMQGEISERTRWIISILAFGCMVFILSLAIGIWFLVKPYPTGLLSAAVIIPFVMIFIILLNRKIISPNRGAFAILLITCLDLLWINSSLLTGIPMPKSPVYENWIADQSGLFRIYSPSYSLPEPNSLQQANGVDPLHLATYADYMAKASNIPSQGYSVSLPDIYIDSRTSKAIRNSAASPNIEMLARLNVKYIASNFPLTSSGVLLKFSTGDKWIYQIANIKERAWIYNGLAKVTLWSPNKIVVRTDSPGGLLILSEIMYPGWQAQTDGHAQEIQVVDGLFRGVRVGSGIHTTVFQYKPSSFFYGLAICVFGWIAAIYLLLKRA
jgi:hypothetical protein